MTTKMMAVDGKRGRRKATAQFWKCGSGEEGKRADGRMRINLTSKQSLRRLVIWKGQ